MIQTNITIKLFDPFIEMSLILYHELQFWILSLFFITNYATCYFHRAVIQEHIDQGNIYNTIDDNHFKSALNGWSCRKSSFQALCRYGAVSSKKCKPSAGSPLSCRAYSHQGVNSLTSRFRCVSKYCSVMQLCVTDIWFEWTRSTCRTSVVFATQVTYK